MNTPVRRRRRSPEEKRKILEEWQASGLRVGAFSERVGVGKNSLHAWRRLYENEAKTSAPQFVSVTVHADSTSAQPPAQDVVAFDIVTPTGHRVRLYRGYAIDDLRAVAAVLGVMRC